MSRTACDVMKEANRRYSRPTMLLRDEVDDLADELYYLLQEMHEMAERMDAKLIEYHDFVTGLLKDGSLIMGSD